MRHNDKLGRRRSLCMPPSDDTFYARIPTLSDAELFNYTQNYSRYKSAAVQAAIAELRTRGLHLSNDELSQIELYFTRKAHPITRPFNCDPSQLRLLSYAIFTIGILSAVFIYVTASPPSQHPLGYDPLARIIHQSQKLTEEGALGSRMIRQTAVSQERHHPKTSASGCPGTVPTGRLAIIGHKASSQPPQAYRKLFALTPRRAPRRFPEPARLDARTPTRSNCASIPAPPGTTRVTIS